MYIYIISLIIYMRNVHVLIVLYMCFSGVILPTCWDYLHEEFGAQKWLYGLTISAMSISNLLIGPIMGAIYDKTHQTKILVLFLNLFEIGGQLITMSVLCIYIMYMYMCVRMVGNFEE